MSKTEKVYMSDYRVVRHPKRQIGCPNGCGRAFIRQVNAEQHREVCPLNDVDTTQHPIRENVVGPKVWEWLSTAPPYMSIVSQNINES